VSSARAWLSRLGPERLAALVVGGALAGVAFGAAGGTQLGRTAVVEMLMVLLGGAVVTAAIVWGRRGPLYGGTSLMLFAAVAALTALSVTWAMVPELGYVEAGRTLAYLSVFAAGVAGARLAPRSTKVPIVGILLAAIAAVAYALAARVWPASLGENEISNRIGQPFEYWNAVGTTAALAIPGLLWLGSRRGGSVAVRALAYPAVGAAILAILLTQSRGALAAAALGAIAWFAIVPLRLRSLPVVLVPSVGAGLVAVWALSKDAFAETAQPLAAKEAVAGDFGLLLLLMAVVLTLAGLAVNVGLSRVAPPMRIRRRLGIAAVVVACAVPLVAFTSVAFSDGGLGGTIEDRVDELTSETETAPAEQGAGRFTAASSTRGKYWREAGRVFAERRSVGVGAGNFAAARLRHRTDASATRHAHGFVPQTLADLGILGVALTAVLLLAWLVAAARATALHPRRLPFLRRNEGDEPLPRRDWNTDRTAVVALTLIVIVFGLQSAIDWTWFVPGPAAMALVGAGFVAGRGPAAALPEGRATVDLREPFRKSSAPRLLAATAVLLTALLSAWAIWQPEAADRATGDAIALADGGNANAALEKTRDAADTNPLSAEPLLVEAAIATRAGREDEARVALEQAVLKFPGDAETWYRLAAFQLGTLDRPGQAAETIRGALYLDPFSQPARQLFLEARASEREKLAEAQERRPGR
jgi:O-antigen ligase/polysaccharide polymerase Wzy-like membrane protein